MTRNKRISILNLVIYIAMFATDMILVGIVKDVMAGTLGDAFSGGEIVFGNIASAALMILAMLMLVISGLASVINVMLKILQISFGKWGFSVASVVIDALVVLWTGIVSISYLSGTSLEIGFICLGLFLAAISALSLECVVITKRKEF